ncbi:MAG TPA: TIM-barrel domain-containing protein [Patescibacteria group bacterium]|nr:TIM-barrel domain-containing protein [Patescibacteria group bacterium]
MRKSILVVVAVICCLALAGCGWLGGPQCSRSADALVCGEARFEFLAPTLVRMEYSASRRFVDAPTAVVTGRRWPATKFTFVQRSGWLTATTKNLTLRYHLDSGRFSAHNMQIAWQEDGENRAWVPGQADPLNLGGISGSLDGAAQNHFPPPSDGVLSRSGYFLLDDSRTPVWDSQTAWIAPRPDPNGQDWYFLEYGRDYRKALADCARLIGPVPMPPRYALGTMITDLNYEFLPSSDLVRNYSYSDRDVEKLVTRFRAARIPLDVLVLDFAWHKYGWQGGYDWSPVFPHPDRFLQWAHAHGLKIALNDHPGYAGETGTVLSNDDSHAAEIRRLLSLPASGPIRWNLADKRQAEAFMRVLHFPLMNEGVDFWWVDGGSGAADMPGLNPRMWTNRVYYDFSQQHTGKRAFIMSRYGGWGSGRYSAFFTGDTNSEWDVLAVEIGYTARGGNVLEPYITHDIGGYHGKDIPFDLYARWVEFGAFSPLVRVHSAFENPRDGNLRMPWTYGRPGIALVRKYFALRYRLLPYIYTFARAAYDDALPLVRPLYLEYPADPRSYAYPNEYFFGNEMLVAPISDPSGEEEIYLPPGAWTDFSSGQTYPGGSLLSVHAPLDMLPIFVKSGSIVPLAPDMAYSNQKPLDRLTLAVYGPDSARFRLYEDDGNSLGYRSDQFAWTPISFQPSGPGRWQIDIGPTAGSFQNQVTGRAYSIELHGLPEPTVVNVDGRQIFRQAASAPGWSWDKSTSVATIRLGSRSIRAPIRIAISTAP